MYRGISVPDIRITSSDKILSIVYENRLFNNKNLGIQIKLLCHLKHETTVPEIFVISNHELYNKYMYMYNISMIVIVNFILYYTL